MKRRLSYPSLATLVCIGLLVPPACTSTGRKGAAEGAMVGAAAGAAGSALSAADQGKRGEAERMLPELAEADPDMADADAAQVVLGELETSLRELRQEFDISAG